MTTEQAIELIEAVWVLDNNLQDGQAVTNTFLGLLCAFAIAFSLLSFMFMRGGK